MHVAPVLHYRPPRKLSSFPLIQDNQYSNSGTPTITHSTLCLPHFGASPDSFIRNFVNNKGKAPSVNCPKRIKSDTVSWLFLFREVILLLFQVL
jgi:hypothetical protein